MPARCQASPSSAPPRMPATANRPPASHQAVTSGRVRRRLGDGEPAVAGEDRAARRSSGVVGAVDEEQRDVGAVVGGVRRPGSTAIAVTSGAPGSGAARPRTPSVGRPPMQRGGRVNEVKDEDGEVLVVVDVDADDVARRRRAARSAPAPSPSPSSRHSSATPHSASTGRAASPPARGSGPVDAPGGGRRSSGVERRPVGRASARRAATATTRPRSASSVVTPTSRSRRSSKVSAVSASTPSISGRPRAGLAVEQADVDPAPAERHRDEQPAAVARQLDRRPRRRVGQVVGPERPRRRRPGRRRAVASGRGGGTRRPPGSGCRRSRCRRAPRRPSTRGCRGCASSRRRAGGDVEHAQRRLLRPAGRQADGDEARRRGDGSYQSMVAVASPSSAAGSRSDPSRPPPSGDRRTTSTAWSWSPQRSREKIARRRCDGAADCPARSSSVSRACQPGRDGDGVEDRAGAGVLGVGPGRDLGVVAVLQPAVGVGDLDAVEDLDDVVGPGRRCRRDEAGAQLPRFPAFGFVPWLAFDVRAFIFRLAVFFDIGG